MFKFLLLENKMHRFFIIIIILHLSYLMISEIPRTEALCLVLICRTFPVITVSSIFFLSSFFSSLLFSFFLSFSPLSSSVLFLLPVFPLQACFIFCSHPILLEYCSFFSAFIVFAFQFGKLPSIHPSSQISFFLRGVQFTNTPIKGILQFCCSVFHL